MALPETRYQFRTSLSDTDRGVDARQTLVALLHPSEVLERLYLRLIAWALWYTPGLRFGPGLSEPDEPALFDVDLTGRRTAWIGINPPAGEKVQFAVRHSKGAQVGAAFAGRRAYEEFVEGSRSLKGLEDVDFVIVDEALLATLASELEERRYDVNITVVEGHLYVDAGGKSFTGTFDRFRGLPQPST